MSDVSGQVQTYEQVQTCEGVKHLMSQDRYKHVKELKHMNRYKHMKELNI